MGCLSRVGCFVVVAGAAAVGYWLYGSRLPSKVSQVASATTDKVIDVASDAARRARASSPKENPPRGTLRVDSGSKHDMAVRDSARTRGDVTHALKWVTVSADPVAQQTMWALLKKRTGPAFVSLDAQQFTHAFGHALRAPLPKSASNVEVAFDDRQLMLRAMVDVSVLAGDGTLSQLLGTVLQGRDTVQLSGTLDPIRVGLAQYHVEALRIKNIDVPPRIIPMVLKTFRRNHPNDGVADDAIGIVLPTSIADLRLSNSKLTLYKAVPEK